MTRCVQVCHDKVQAQVRPQTNPAQMRRFQAQLEQCIVFCADAHMVMVPALGKKLRQSVHKVATG